MPIQKDRTFDNFVVGDCNRESRAAAPPVLAIQVNSIHYLFTATQDLAKHIYWWQSPTMCSRMILSKKVYYTESIKFVENVVNSIRDNKIDAFKQYM